MGKNIYTIKKNTEAILATNQVVGLEENAEDTMNKMKDNIEMHNKSFASVQTFKDYGTALTNYRTAQTNYGTALTNQDCMHEKIKQQIKFTKFLLPFSPDYYVFPFAS
jgi:hypothetical protein